MASASISRYWQRYRRPLVIAAILGWALFITVAYRRGQDRPGTTKGAGELLEIGALPVT